MKARARRDAKTLKVPLFYSQAVDLSKAGKLKRAEAQRLLHEPNPFNTGRLMSVCPLHVGQRVRLSQVVDKKAGLVQEAEGTVVAVILARNEPAQASDGVRWLKKLPVAVYVQFDHLQPKKKKKKKNKNKKEEAEEAAAEDPAAAT